MKLQVLGCSGAELPFCNPPGYLIDGTLLLDAGTVCGKLPLAEQQRLETILLSHAHLDHCREIPVLADNLVISSELNTVTVTVTVAATAQTIGALRNHLMNGIIWPDFTTLPDPQTPAIRYRELVPGVEVAIQGYRVTPVPVDHPIPAVGYLLRDGSFTFLYSGDTGPTEALWRAAGSVDVALVEVSFPNELEELALLSGHLTPKLLRIELAKLPRPPGKILVTHTKPQFTDRIAHELSLLPLPGVELLREGMTYDL